MIEEKMKILIVDDEEKWINIIKRRLAKIASNAQLFTADSFVAAKKLVDEHFFHVAILDIRLVFDEAENQQGMALQKYIFEKGEATGIIMLSGFGSPERILKSWQKYDAIGFLQKEDFDKNLLAKSLEKALKQSKTYLASCVAEQSSFEHLKNQSSIGPYFSKLSYENKKALENLWKSFVTFNAPLVIEAKSEPVKSEGGAQFTMSMNCFSRMKGKSLNFEIGTYAQLNDLAHGDKKKIGEMGLVTWESEK